MGTYLKAPTPLPRYRPLMVRPGTVDVERIGLDRAPLSDVYHSLMRAPWPYFVLAFACAYLCINAFFGFLYYLDLAGILNAEPGSFRDAFMFSIQTAATIGYGHLAPHSAYVNVVVVLESMTAILCISLTTGLAFAKFARPRGRVLFSQQAVIHRYEGAPHLMFRIGNGRINQIVDASISVVAVRTQTSPEGLLMRRLLDLHLVRHRSPVFALSWTVMHPIDERSPLFGLGPEDMERDRVELVISLTGIDDTFAQSIHAMHAYGYGDILFGKRHVDMSSVREDGVRVLDFTKFHEVTDA